MPAPSPLSIATGSVVRLMKEEATYHKELAEGQEQLRKLEEKSQNGEPDPDGNADFMIRQHKLSIEQTKAVFGPLRERIEGAAGKLADLLEGGGGNGGFVPEELEKARAALKSARAALNA